MSAQAATVAGAVLAVRFEPPATAQDGRSESPSWTVTRSIGRPRPSAAVSASIVYIPVPASFPAVETAARTPEFSRSRRTRIVAPIAKAGYVAVATPQPTSVLPSRIEPGSGGPRAQPNRAAPRA